MTGPNLQDQPWRHHTDNKVKVAKLVLEMDSSELTHHIQQLIEEKLVLPHVAVQLKYVFRPGPKPR